MSKSTKTSQKQKSTAPKKAEGKKRSSPAKPLKLGGVPNQGNA